MALVRLLLSVRARFEVFVRIAMFALVVVLDAATDALGLI